MPPIVMVSLRGTPYDSTPPRYVPLRPPASSVVFTHAGRAGSSAAEASFSRGVLETDRAARSEVASCDRAMSHVMHVEHVRGFLHQMVVDCGNLKAGGA